MDEKIKAAFNKIKSVLSRKEKSLVKEDKKRDRSCKAIKKEKR